VEVSAMKNKSSGIKHIIDTVFPGTNKKTKEKTCPVCKQRIEGFRDYISEREYEISGLCQECQDSVFGV
jgi:hypothetical protein